MGCLLSIIAFIVGVAWMYAWDQIFQGNEVASHVCGYALFTICLICVFIRIVTSPNKRQERFDSIVRAELKGCHCRTVGTIIQQDITLYDFVLYKRDGSVEIKSVTKDCLEYKEYVKKMR